MSLIRITNCPLGSGALVFFSFGALSKPCLAIKSNGNPFLLGALNGSPATTAPNGDHSRFFNASEETFQAKRRRLQAMIKSPLGVGGSGVFSVSGGVSGGGASPIASSHSNVDNNNGSVSAASFSVEQHGLQSGSNGVSNQCLVGAANVLPDSPPPSTVAALASIANTVVRDAKRRRKQLSSTTQACDFVKETRVWGISSPSPPMCVDDTISGTSGPLASSTHFPCDISTSKRQKLGNPFAFNSSSDQSSLRDERDGACPPGALDVDSPVPLWLTRLFHPPNA